MKTLTVALPGREYNILIERGLLKGAGAYIRTACPRAKRVFVVTDDNVAPLYLEQVETGLRGAGLDTAAAVLPAGEETKSGAMLLTLWEQMMEFGLTRTDAVAALGGGVVGDLAGFAAATILRGVDFVQIPTTLLAQVDSSVGGKVAVDLDHGKNLAGAFWQPRLVLMDPDALDTLPLPVFMAGMAEVLKYGCIWDAGFFGFLAARPARNELMADIEYILHTCCDIKRQVVMEDERDTGLRMILNFGHTVGHAYEKAGRYVEWNHGEAVAAGMCAAAKLGVSLGVTPPDVPKKIENAVAALGLPTFIPCSRGDLTAAVGLDKKSAGDHISLILLDKMGHAVPVKMEKDAVLRSLEAVCGGDAP